MSSDEQYEVDAVVAEAISPTTRRWIILALSLIAGLAIVGEVILAVLDYSASEALLTVAATAVGGIAGMAVPGR